MLLVLVFVIIFFCISHHFLPLHFKISLSFRLSQFIAHILFFLLAVHIIVWWIYPHSIFFLHHFLFFMLSWPFLKLFEVILYFLLFLLLLSVMRIWLLYLKLFMLRLLRIKLSVHFCDNARGFWLLLINDQRKRLKLLFLLKWILSTFFLIFQFYQIRLFVDLSFLFLLIIFLFQLSILLVIIIIIFCITIKIFSYIDVVIPILHKTAFRIDNSTPNILFNLPFTTVDYLQKVFLHHICLNTCRVNDLSFYRITFIEFVLLLLL